MLLGSLGVGDGAAGEGDGPQIGVDRHRIAQRKGAVRRRATAESESTKSSGVQRVMTLVHPVRTG
jgi:hypothetical protein